MCDWLNCLVVAPEGELSDYPGRQVVVLEEGLSDSGRQVVVLEEELSGPGLQVVLRRVLSCLILGFCGFSVSQLPVKGSCLLRSGGTDSGYQRV